MDTMINVWAVVERVRVTSGAAELAIFTAILYWFCTSSRVADMLEVVGERVGGWCGREASGASLRQCVRARRRRHNDVLARLESERQTRATSLYRVKEGPALPAPQPQQRPPAGLACGRCAPLSRESWQDTKTADNSTVMNVLDIGWQLLSHGGVLTRYFCDLAHCFRLIKYNYTDVLPEVVKDERFQKAIEDQTQAELAKGRGVGAGEGEGQASELYQETRERTERKAMKVLSEISSAMSNRVLGLVAWLCHKAIRRVAGGECGTRAACIERLRRANQAGLPLIFVPLHRSHFDYMLVTFTLYLTGLKPPLVAAGDNMRIPFFGWFLRGCGAFYIRRKVDGSEYHGDPVYKSALRAYILNSLAVKNNLEFFIEGGRTRTGKPQPPKAGILSVIMDAYLDGTIDDALLVPVTLNYDRLVDGNFVREQLGRPKQMETFWSALRGIWHTLNTNHGGIRVDFNQPISLKEMVTSFQKYNYLKAPAHSALTPLNNNNLAVDLDRQILYNHSHSSLYDADVSTEHKMMVEAIGRHLVYDAAAATALMSTNVVAYVLMTERRGGCAPAQLQAAVEARAQHLLSAGRDLAYSGDPAKVIKHALEMLGRSLVRRTGSGEKQQIAPRASIAANIELAYYANTVGAHYAPKAIVATALESIIRAPDAEQDVVRHSDLMDASLQLCSILNQEFILCPPCRRIEDLMSDTISSMLVDETITQLQTNEGIEEQQWSRRFARALEEEDDDFQERREDPMARIKYRLNPAEYAVQERQRLLRTLRPLLEAYAATCRAVETGSQKDLVKRALDSLTLAYTRNIMTYGEAVSTDAIRNCLRLLKVWGVVNLYTQERDRRVHICPPYDNQKSFDEICYNVYKFNMATPLLRDS